MVLILIGEFVEDKPGDDIKLVAQNSEVILDNAMKDIIVPTYLGLFSSTGNGTGEKHGTVPLVDNKSAIAWSYHTAKTRKSRLLVVVVPFEELNDTIIMINNHSAQNRIRQIKAILVQEEINMDGLENVLNLLESSLKVPDEASRLSDVFGTEI